GIRTIDSPIQIQGEGLEKVKPQNPPAVGEHTVAQLSALGYSEEELKALAEAHVIGLPRK
uniref:hypothetical protein n=1 Tax=Carboxylicivirga taeanensis TaxID=1416875 RepID=UPI003F6E29C5